MALIHIERTDLETVLQLRMQWSEPPRSREAALSPGDLAPEAAHFAAYLGSELAGVYSIGPEPLPVLNHPPAWRYRGLIVLPQFRDRGIGPALVQFQLQEIEARPHPLAWSYAKSRVIPFFSHFGYRPTGYTYEHPVGGPTQLLGNAHTLKFIAAATGIDYRDDELPKLGRVTLPMNDNVTNLDLVRVALRGYLKEALPLVVENASIADDASLSEQGALDSLGLIKLVTFLEQRFGIEIQADDFGAGRFSSLASIEQLVLERI